MSGTIEVESEDARIGNVIELTLGPEPANYEIVDIEQDPPVQSRSLSRRPPQAVPPRLVLRKVE